MQLPRLPEPCKRSVNVAECMLTVQQAAILEINSGPLQCDAPMLRAHIPGSPTNTCAQLMLTSREVR